MNSNTFISLQKIATKAEHSFRNELESRGHSYSAKSFMKNIKRYFEVADIDIGEFKDSKGKLVVNDNLTPLVTFIMVQSVNKNSIVAK